jgi:hypothetical protein
MGVFEFLVIDGEFIEFFFGVLEDFFRGSPGMVFIDEFSNGSLKGINIQCRALFGEETHIYPFEVD